MLIGIPRIISPVLMRTLMEMGHGDELVIADANFPAHSVAALCTTHEPIRCDGGGVAELLDAILGLMPLDYAVESPAAGMAARQGMAEPPIHRRLRQILANHGYGAEKLEMLARPDFLLRARGAYAVVITAETARFANIIVKKGVIDLS